MGCSKTTKVRSTRSSSQTASSSTSNISLTSVLDELMKSAATSPSKTPKQPDTQYRESKRSDLIWRDLYMFLRELDCITEETYEYLIDELYC